MIALLYYSWMGETKLGSKLRLQEAMNKGDGKNAVFFAEKLVSKWNQNHDFDDFYIWQLAYAYELNKEYDKSVEILIKFELSSSAELMDLARVYRKQGMNIEAFVEYCDQSLKYEPWRVELIDNAVMCKHLGGSKQWLCPYASYSDFMIFMESEYANIENPSRYGRAMDVFRSLAKENTQREQAERIQKLLELQKEIHKN